VLLEGWFNSTAGRKLYFHRKDEPDVLAPGIVPPLYDD
jgi:hypothetical protein